MFQTMPIFVYKLFETMQSSVTESRTFATKSLPASFKYCNYLLIYSRLQQNTKFYKEKQLFPIGETLLLKGVLFFCMKELIRIIQWKEFLIVLW